MELFMKKMILTFWPLVVKVTQNLIDWSPDYVQPL